MSRRLRARRSEFDIKQAVPGSSSADEEESRRPRKKRVEKEYDSFDSSDEQSSSPRASSVRPRRHVIEDSDEDELANDPGELDSNLGMEAQDKDGDIGVREFAGVEPMELDSDSADSANSHSESSDGPSGGPQGGTPPVVARRLQSAYPDISAFKKLDLEQDAALAADAPFVETYDSSSFNGQAPPGAQPPLEDRMEAQRQRIHQLLYGENGARRIPPIPTQECSICKQELSIGKMFEHKLQNHTPAPEFNCTFCDPSHTLKDLRDYVNHMQISLQLTSQSNCAKAHLYKQMQEWRDAVTEADIGHLESTQEVVSDFSKRMIERKTNVQGSLAFLL